MDNQTNNTELSRYEMLERFLTDDALNDVTLQGSDGVTVPANRFLLAARSSVFQSMLLGKFQESSSPVVEIGFQGAVLKAIVEYILTDSAEMLNAVNKRRSDDSPNINYPQIQSIVSLASAATYFNLPGLGKLVFEGFKKIGKAWPSLSFAILQACKTAGPSVPDNLVEQSLAFVRETPAESISASGVVCLSDIVLEEILKDTDTQMTEYQLFLVLSQWVEAAYSDDTQQEGRQKTAMRLSKYICLNKIDPDLLSTTVTSSGLCTVEDLSEAYKHQALKAKRSNLESFSTPRNAKWTSVIPENSYPPSQIMVEGAGSDEVNGVYVREESNEKFPKYIMQGQRQGEPCVYWLFAPYYGDWFISIPDKDKPGTNADTDFYIFPRHDDVPPSENWMRVREGVEPPPKLLYNLFAHQGNQ